MTIKEKLRRICGLRTQRIGEASNPGPAPGCLARCWHGSACPWHAHGRCLFVHEEEAEIEKGGGNDKGTEERDERENEMRKELGEMRERIRDLTEKMQGMIGKIELLLSQKQDDGEAKEGRRRRPPKKKRKNIEKRKPE